MAGVLAAFTSGAAGLINQALPDGTNALSASISFENDGDYVYGNGAGGADTVDWVTPSDAAIATQYQLQVNVTAGTIDGGTVDSWIDLSTTRTYIKSSAGTATLRVRIREKLSTNVRTDQVVVIDVT